MNRWSSYDESLLAHLLAEYGPEDVIEKIQADFVQLDGRRPVGRPKKDEPTKYAHYTDEIDLHVEVHAKALDAVLNDFAELYRVSPVTMRRYYRAGARELSLRDDTFAQLFDLLRMRNEFTEERALYWTASCNRVDVGLAKAGIARSADRARRSGKKLPVNLIT